MIATVVNALAVIVGSLVGLLLHAKIKESFKAIVYIGAGTTTLVIGIQMALNSSKIVYLALSLIIGGILGTWWRIEDGILTLAAGWLKPLVSEALLKELTGVGGALVIMIAINLLGLAKLKTANFLPALVLIAALVVGEGFALSHHLLGM